MESLVNILKTGLTTTKHAFQIYDELDEVNIDFMIGRWKGTEFRTGHKMDGLLNLTGWYGKLFIDQESVHPLLFYTHDKSGLYAVNPDLIPLSFRIPKTGLLKRIMALSKPILQTKKTKARLRMMEYRGKLSATMIYDGKAINDHFRKIDDRHVMGLMDLKGEPQPYFFILEKDDSPYLKIQLPLT